MKKILTSVLVLFASIAGYGLTDMGRPSFLRHSQRSKSIQTQQEIPSSKVTKNSVTAAAMSQESFKPYFKGSDVAVDPSGMIYVAGEEVTDEVGWETWTNGWIAKYDNHQILLSSTTSPNCKFKKIVRDEEGNLYVAGQHEIQYTSKYGLSRAWNILVQKYSPALKLLNEYEYDTVKFGYSDQDIANDLAFAPNGDLVVVGQIVNAYGKNKMFVGILDKDLNLKKSQHYRLDDPSTYSEGMAVSFDQKGNILVATDISSDRDFGPFVLRFDFRLNFLDKVEAFGETYAYPQAMVVNADGDIFVSGHYYSPYWDESQIWVSKVNGQTGQFSSVIVDPTPKIDLPSKLTLDPQGHVFMSAVINFDENSVIGPQTTQGWVAKFSSSLVLQSSFTFSGNSPLGENGAWGLAQGNNAIYVTGVLTNSDGKGPYLNKMPLNEPPTNVNVTEVSTGTIASQWTGSFGATDYKIGLSSENSLDTSKIKASVKGTQASVGGLLPNTTYYGFVSACDDIECSSPSPFGPIVTMAKDPKNLVVGTIGETSVDFSFDGNWNPFGTRYVIKADSGHGFLPVLTTESTTPTITKLISGQTYQFQVAAMNHNGVETDPTTTVSAKTLVVQTHRFFGNALETDSSGVSYVAGYEEVLSGKVTEATNGWIGKYNSSQVLQSSVVFRGAHFDAMVRDQEGYLYALGTRQTDGGDDMLIVKYDPSLVQVASQAISGPVPGDEQGRRVAMASNGDLVVLGQVTRENNLTSLWVGQVGTRDLMVKRSETYPKSGMSNVEGHSLTFDGQGNIYVTGEMNEGTTHSGIVLKYSPDLGFLDMKTCWTNGGVSDKYIYGSQIAASPSGELVVALNVVDNGTTSEIQIGKLNSALSLVNPQILNPTLNDDHLLDIQFGPDGDIYLAGSFNDNLEAVFDGADPVQSYGWVGRFTSNLGLKSSISITGDDPVGSNSISALKIVNNALYTAGQRTELTGTTAFHSKISITSDGSGLTPPTNAKWGGVSTGVISMEWTGPSAATTYYAWVSLINNPTVVQKKVSATEPKAVIDGLTPNTTYFGFINACAGLSCSNNLPFGPVVTLAKAPKDLTIGTIGEKSVTLSFDVNGNPEGTRYNIEADSGEGYSTVLTTESASPTVTRLSPGQTYQIRVKAVNHGNIESEPSTGVSLETLELETRHYHGYGVEADSNGTSYVVGEEEVRLGSNDSKYNGWIGIYNRDKVQQSSSVLQRPYSSYFSGVARDKDGYLYAFGGIDLDAIGNDTNLIIVKYSPSLVVVASRTFTREYTGYDYAIKIEMATNGDLIVMGRVQRDAEHYNLWIERLGPDLSLVRSDIYPKAGNSTVHGGSFTFDPQGNLYATALMSEGEVDWVVALKYSGGLRLLSERTIWTDGGVKGKYPYDSVVASNPSGEMVIGLTVFEGKDTSILLGKLSSALSLTNSVMMNPTVNNDVILDIKFNRDGDVYMAGVFNDNSENVYKGATPVQSIGWVGRFSSNLLLKSSTTFTGTDPLGSNGVRSLKIVNNTLFLAGDISNADGTVVLLSKDTIPDNPPPPPTNDVSEARGYPSMFQPSKGHTQIFFDHMPIDARIQIYSMSGGLVKEIIVPFGSSSWDVKNDAGEEVTSGVYYVRVIGTGGDKTFKIVVQR